MESGSRSSGESGSGVQIDSESRDVEMALTKGLDFEHVDYSKPIEMINIPTFLMEPIAHHVSLFFFGICFGE